MKIPVSRLEKFTSDNARVDTAAIQSLPNSRKIYIQGSRADIRVPMREISQSDTNTSQGIEKKTRPSASTILRAPTRILTPI